MCLSCHGAQYAGRNRLQFYVATYMHITNLKALGKKHSKSLHQLTSTHRQSPRVSVNVFGLPWSAVCLPQLAWIVCCNIHAHEHQAENIKIIAMPACERCCSINLLQRIGSKPRVSCKCVWLAMERSMLAAIGFNCMLQHTCTWLT